MFPFSHDLHNSLPSRHLELARMKKGLGLWAVGLGLMVGAAAGFHIPASIRNMVHHLVSSPLLFPIRHKD